MSGSELPLPGERAAFWRGHVEAWKRSGLTARDYCSQHELNRGTLGYWASRLRRMAATAAAPAFLPVEVAAPPDSPGGDAGIVLELAPGLRLRLARDFDAGTLVRVLAVVQR